MQIQIEQTKIALERIGVMVEPLRWWDESQTGDIIHYFGRIPAILLRAAQQKGIKVVFSDLLGAQGARSPGRLRLQRLLTRVLQRTLPPARAANFNWEGYRRADACVALTPWEAHLMSYIFGAPPQMVHVVPNGVEGIFLDSPRADRGPWLVCTATITEVKRVVHLAQAATLAQTPIWIIGKAYAESQAYTQQFYALARQNPKILRYEGSIPERDKLARAYREARGFVLLSAWESLSLSALEAAACECPLLLSDLPWARTTFADGASYCPVASAGRTAPVLRRFYDSAPGLKLPPKPPAWTDVARQLKQLYTSLLKTAS